VATNLEIPKGDHNFLD